MDSDFVATLAVSPATDALVEDAVVWASQHGLVRGALTLSGSGMSACSTELNVQHHCTKERQ